MKRFLLLYLVLVICGCATSNKFSCYSCRDKGYIKCMAGEFDFICVDGYWHSDYVEEDTDSFGYLIDSLTGDREKCELCGGSGRVKCSRCN